jgi:hypothetical protein
VSAADGMFHWRFMLLISRKQKLLSIQNVENRENRQNLPVEYQEMYIPYPVIWGPFAKFVDSPYYSESEILEVR